MASAVADSRFKTLPVTKRNSIKSFVELNKLSFKKGRGFYQLSKAEVIQDYKEIIIRRKSDGVIITGDKVRDELGIPKSSKKFKIDLDEIPDFDVFVQSTSVNRILLPSTDFLYESDEPESTVKPKAPATGKAKADTGKKTPARGTKRKATVDPPEEVTKKTPARGAKRKATVDPPEEVTKKTPARGAKCKATVDPPEEVTKKTPARGAKRKTTVDPPEEVTKKTPARGAKRKATVDPPEASPEKKTKVSTPAKGRVGAKESSSKSAPSKEKADDKSKGATPSDSKTTAPLPPGGPVEIVFSFDTTGSMYPCLTQVRRKVSDTVKRLQKEIPGIKIAIIAHGDYCDSYTYVTKILDFTNDVTKLCSFVENVQGTGGGDWEECYELVLHETRTKLSWTPGTQRSLVMIGDAIPHPPSYGMNTLKLDWKKEAKQLYDDLGCRIYSVQALNNSASVSFYRELARLTNGYHLHLDQFSSIVQFIMAICFREQSIEQLQAFEDEVRTKGTGVNRSLHKLFDTLAGRETTYTGGEGSGDLSPVDSSRFQVLDVDQRQDIKTFVQKNGLIFKAGRGFYEFTKAEKISDKKEVVLIDKVTGDIYTGPEACRVIGAGGSGKIKPTCLDKWRVFVQSTSYNRVLMPNTGFLYEVDPEH